MRAWRGAFVTPPTPRSGCVKIRVALNHSHAISRVFSRTVFGAHLAFRGRQRRSRLRENCCLLLDLLVGCTHWDLW